VPSSSGLYVLRQRHLASSYHDRPALGATGRADCGVATVGEEVIADNDREVSKTRAIHPAATLQFPYLKLHQFVYRHSGGLIGSRIIAGGTAPATTGRRSGEPRTCALIYLKDGERLVVVASNGGRSSAVLAAESPSHPGVAVRWPKKFSARASVASAEERERLWPRVSRHNMGLAPIMHPGARGRYDVPAAHHTRDLSCCWNETRES
jgi:deazaflavin-dependent oxidoreductase (nitroreductase family)